MGALGIINSMKLDQSKCWILHLEGSNTRYESKLGEEWLQSSAAGKDLRVLVGTD